MQVNKFKFRKKNYKTQTAHMVRSGVYNVLVISIVMYILKQSRIWGGGRHSCNLKIINLKYLVHGTCHGMEQCRGQWSKVIKLEVYKIKNLVMGGGN